MGIDSVQFPFAAMVLQNLSLFLLRPKAYRNSELWTQLLNGEYEWINVSYAIIHKVICRRQGKNEKSSEVILSLVSSILCIRLRSCPQAYCGWLSARPNSARTPSSSHTPVAFSLTIFTDRVNIDYEDKFVRSFRTGPTSQSGPVRVHEASLMTVIVDFRDNAAFTAQ